MNQYRKSYAKLESIQGDMNVWQKLFSEATVSKNRKRLPSKWSNQRAKEFYKIDGFTCSVNFKRHFVKQTADKVIMNCDFYCNIAECKLKGSARMDNKYHIHRF